jgi:hypothetical protein
VAEPNEAGTPQAEPPVSESAGTGGQAADGSEQTGKPVDPALAMAWKAKAERVNDVERRLVEAEAKLAAAQQVQYAQQAQADPQAQIIQQLRERAQYGDTDAIAQLSIWTLTATQQAENMLTKELVRRQVPADLWDTVEGLVRQSGYRMSVEQAVQLARGREVPDLAKQLEAERKRREELERVLNARTVGNPPGGNAAATPPAAMSADDIPEMSPEEYNRLLSTLPPDQAKALRDKGVRFKR